MSDIIDMLDSFCQMETSTFKMLKLAHSPEYFGGWHECAEILYVLDGTQYVGIEDKIYEVRGGELLWIAPYVMHIINPQGACYSEFYSLHYSNKYIFGRESSSEKEFLSKYYRLFKRDRNRQSACLLKSADAPELSRILDALYSSYVNENNTYRYECLIRGMMLCILGELGECSCLDENIDMNNTSFPIDEICLYIEQNLKDITQEKTASHFGYSRSFFSRCFHEATGTSYMEYVKFVKTHEAVTMLMNGMSIDDISEVLGYSGASYLRRVLKGYRNCQ